MAKFHKYLHVYRLDAPDVEGILDGKCFIQPKMDGTNSSVWFDTYHNKVCAGSRTRELSNEKDNAAFYFWVNTDALEARELRKFVTNNPRYTVCGEWLGLEKFIGNIKDYDPEAKGHLWIFDLYDNEEDHYVDYNNMVRILSENNLATWIIPCIDIVENPTEDQLIEIAKNNTFNLTNANHAGEGVVIKNYDFRNKYGHFEVAKIVLDEYKQYKAESKKVKIEPGEIEKTICDLYCTESEMAKNKAKVVVACNDVEFNNTNKKHVGMFLNLCYTDSVLGDTAIWVKKLKNPTVDFKVLQYLVFAKAREYIGL